VAHLVLEVIPDPVRAIREMARVLKPGGRVAVFDKFLGDPASPSLPRRAANALTRVVGIDINRRLGPLVEASGLALEWEEPLGLTGLFRLARLVKPSQAKEERA
jgi:phosphatidylethanolamine/phosphatidyl-N-methylethanolamine N-methyltransferase